MAQYLIEERVLRPAPQIKSTQVISLTEAAKRLGVSYPTLYNYFSAGTLTAVVDSSQRTAYKRFRRYVLRQELELLKSARDDTPTTSEEEKTRRATAKKLVAEARRRTQSAPLSDAEFASRFAEARAAILEEAIKEGTAIEGEFDDDDT
ncbi:MAG: hypothetical protein ACPGWR_24715 [Ardenticatenaceae bacterium]